MKNGEEEDFAGIFCSPFEMDQEQTKLTNDNDSDGCYPAITALPR